jgi:hypothetical protein
MQPLEKTLRNQLERTVKAARTVAESAAGSALQQLGVGEAAAFAHMSDEESDLRRRLRIHGRQLGDKRHSEKKTQELDRLIEEVGYEHWHRMLFARFLAENNLLMYPDPSGPVAVSLEECEDLAADEGAANGWELAAQYAARMLPQIFRLDSPVFQLSLPPEYQQRLEKHVESLPTEVFTASDSLGWVYQFWQADNKERINRSEVKIGARELPAVTQLFRTLHGKLPAGQRVGGMVGRPPIDRAGPENRDQRRRTAPQGVDPRRAARLPALCAGRGRHLGPGGRNV